MTYAPPACGTAGGGGYSLRDVVPAPARAIPHPPQGPQERQLAPRLLVQPQDLRFRAGQVFFTLKIEEVQRGVAVCLVVLWDLMLCFWLGRV